MKKQGLIAYKVMPIDRELTREWILNIHYAKRMPPVSYAFGLFRNDMLVGVATYGMPASPYLCRGVCGEQWADKVLELNRLVLSDNRKNEASMLVARSLKMLPTPRIVVSYADKEMGHIGYVYQATNWIYTGATKERTDIFSESGHARHHCGDKSKRQPRSSKHRYVQFTGNKREKREMAKSLNYEVLEYPKGNNKYYEITGKVLGRQISLL